MALMEAASFAEYLWGEGAGAALALLTLDLLQQAQGMGRVSAHKVSYLHFEVQDNVPS